MSARSIAAAVLLAALAACGVDGPPVRPAAPPQDRFQSHSRVTISGDATVGVVAEL